MKTFTFECPQGHAFDESFGHLDPIPDHIDCTQCPTTEPPVQAERLKVYRMAGVRLPTSTTAIKPGF
jgi:hypothetical protein